MTWCEYGALFLEKSTMRFNIENLIGQIRELASSIEEESGEVKVAIADYELNGKHIQIFLSATDDYDLLWEETHPDRICARPE